jgi:hypothetical protein
MQQTRIIWFAIFFSTVIYFGIIFTLQGNPEGTFDEAVRKPLVLPLYAGAFGSFLAGLIGFGSLKQRDAKAAMTMRLALFEGAAIMGLLAAWFAQDWRVYLPAWALAVIGFIREWPES